MSNAEEIALLEYHQAYIARTSMLQSRLLSTLDTLDVLQRTHREELLSITTERDKKNLELQGYTNIAKSAKLEMDDMRDAVMILIEKVKISNDYSTWPHSQIYLSSLADMALPNQPSHVPENEGNSLSYAVSLIEILRKQRDSERLAHARTRDLADAQLVSLKAKLSRRDVELESCIASGGHLRPPKESRDFGPAPAGSRTERGRHVEYEPISRDEMVSVSDLTAARNKILDTEVKILAKRLDEAKSARRRARTFAAPTKSPPNPDNDSLQPVGSKRSLSKGRPITSSDSDLVDFQNQINELGLKIDAFAAERKAICESVGLATLRVEPDLEVRTSLFPWLLGASLTLPRGKKDPNNSSNELHMLLQHAELECDRLRRRETELCDQLNDTRTDAREREAELLTEISAMTEKLQQGTSTTTYAEVAVETEDSLLPPANLLEPYEGEQSMELATPLMPTSFLMPHTDDVNIFQHATRPSLNNAVRSGNFAGLEQIREEYYSENHTPEIESPYVDPPSIPLPQSPELEPEGLSAWEENSPSGFTISASDFPIPPRFPSPPPSSLPGRSSSNPALLDKGFRRKKS